MLASGALVNTLAFSRSNNEFHKLRNLGVDDERKRHDKPIEKLQASY